MNRTCCHCKWIHCKWCIHFAMNSFAMKLSMLICNEYTIFIHLQCIHLQWIRFQYSFAMNSFIPNKHSYSLVLLRLLVCWLRPIHSMNRIVSFTKIQYERKTARACVCAHLSRSFESIGLFYKETKWEQDSVCAFISNCTHAFMCECDVWDIYKYLCTYIQIWEGESQRKRERVRVCVCLYVFIYVCVCVYMWERNVPVSEGLKICTPI